MAERIAGTAYLKVDGVKYEVGDSLTVSLATVTREPVTGLSGVAGYKEIPRTPYIEAEIIYVSETDIEEIEGTTKANVQVELANGKVGLLKDAWQAGEIEVNAENGRFTVRFEGSDGKWL